MKFKLDENFGTRTVQLFKDAGHEVLTVRDENLGGTEDINLFEKCRTEGLCLVTLDLDFADVLRFPPGTSAGIVVIRVPHNPSLTLLERLVAQFLNALAKMPMRNELWIVEVGRVCIHQRDVDE